MARDFLTPPTSKSAHVWLASGTDELQDILMVGLAGTGPGQAGHTLALPATAQGLAGLLKILRDRAQAPQAPKLDQPGAPSGSLEFHQRKHGKIQNLKGCAHCRADYQAKEVEQERARKERLRLNIRAGALGARELQTRTKKSLEELGL